jgi:hypothetical protein
LHGGKRGDDCDDHANNDLERTTRRQAKDETNTANKDASQEGAEFNPVMLKVQGQNLRTTKS